MSSLYRIRIFSDFCRSEDCKEIYERLCEKNLMNNYGDNNNIFITNNDDYTHAIILNTAMPILSSKIPKKNVVGFAFEPPKFLKLSAEFIKYAEINIGKYYIGDAAGLPPPFIERYSHMWYNPPLNKTPEKKNIMSIMVSEKLNEKGHLYRHQLVNKILETNLPIDVYGRGCKYYSFMNDDRVKGDFKETEPYNDYMFHICIENIELNEYFSEKIMNPLLSNTTPIYLGCKNIDNYFPGNIIHLSGNIKEDTIMITNICNNPDHFVKDINVESIKDVIFLLRNLDNIYGSK
jgi:hypothetical protein